MVVTRLELPGGQVFAAVTGSGKVPYFSSLSSRLTRFAVKQGDTQRVDGERAKSARPSVSEGSKDESTEPSSRVKNESNKPLSLKVATPLVTGQRCKARTAAFVRNREWARVLKEREVGRVCRDESHTLDKWGEDRIKRTLSSKETIDKKEVTPPPKKTI